MDDMANITLTPMDDVQFAVHEANERTHWWFTARRTIVIAVVRRLLEGVRSPLVLDVGSGTGATVAAFSEFCQAVGVEPSTAAYSRACRRYPHCTFIHGKAPDAVRDYLNEAHLVTMMDVLEHVADDHELLRSNVLLARPGTWFVLTVPADMTLWSGHDVALGHFRRYAPESFSHLWRELPVDCHLLTPLNTRLEPIVRFFRRIPLGKNLRGGEAGTDLRLPPTPINNALHRVFAGEKTRILKGLDARNTDVRSRSVSLLAVLRRNME